ncbi:hypothetical protein F5Y03DRAFT_6293 [Xylaria venustula]|nr:hypothetical protein F5Y03DRAFT_6293 [Xylaria venustula]
MTANNNTGKSSTGLVAVYLIPWDPDSQEHVDRMKLQRIACGWKFDQVDSWKDPQRKGQVGLHWVCNNLATSARKCWLMQRHQLLRLGTVLHPDHPDTPSRLKSHFAAYPNESQALLDSCKNMLGRPHKPDPLDPFFHPIGHIALDSISYVPELETSLSNGVLSLTNFYISSALQSRGLGGAAMAYCEKMAKEEFGAKAITLETIANEECRADSPRRIALKRPPLAVTNQDWYERHGYRVYSQRSAAWVDIDETGKEWPTTSSLLRKELL